MSASWNDGASPIPYGSRVLTINSVAYVADQITVTRPTKKILRTNELDEPAGSIGVPDFETGSATLQLATGSTAIPTRGLTFTTTFAVSAETFYVDNVTQPESKGEVKQVQITFTKKYS
jgi:hypothetical protein